MKGRPHHTTELVTPHQEDACFFIYDDGKKQVYFFIKMTKMIERFAGLVPVGGNCRPNASRLCFHSCHVKTVGGVQNVMRLDNPELAPHQPPGLLSWSASLGSNNERGTQGRHAVNQPRFRLRLGCVERACVFVRVCAYMRCGCPC